MANKYVYTVVLTAGVGADVGPTSYTVVASSPAAAVAVAEAKIALDGYVGPVRAASVDALGNGDAIVWGT